MKLLLDTHIALWAIADTAKLSSKAIKLLEAENNEIFYSIASVWEIAIKHKINPDNMPISEEEFVELCKNTGFTCLPIDVEHIFWIKTLERPEKAPKHKDPFDRILLAQAKCENLKLMTHDSLISYYGEECVMFI